MGLYAAEAGGGYAVGGLGEAVGLGSRFGGLRGGFVEERHGGK